MNSDRPVIFGGAHFSRAIADDNFFRKLPQFLPIKAKMEAMHADIRNKKGCSSCQKRRVQANLERDFAAIMSSMDPASAKVFKDYFGVGRMLVHSVNPTTHSAYLKEL